MIKSNLCDYNTAMAYLGTSAECYSRKALARVMARSPLVGTVPVQDGGVSHQSITVLF